MQHIHVCVCSRLKLTLKLQNSKSVTQGPQLWPCEHTFAADGAVDQVWVHAVEAQFAGQGHAGGTMVQAHYLQSMLHCVCCCSLHLWGRGYC